MATSLVAELAEKLSSATNNFDIDESTIFVNTSADTVGIGTTSPSAKLDVRGSAIFNEGGLDADFRIEGDTETHLFFLDASTGRVGINSATPGVRFDVVGATKITGALTVGVDDTGHDVKFFGASAGAFMLYDESADTLEIRGPSADASTSTGKLLLSTALTDINDGDVLGRIDFKAPLEAGGTDAIALAASIYAEADATFSASVNETDLIFATGASEAATERMRLDSAGNVGIGTTNPDMRLHIYGSDNNLLHIESTDQDAGMKIEDNGTGHFQIAGAADNWSLGTNGRAEMMRFSSSTAVVFNEDGADQDFRVEADNTPHGSGQAHTIFVEGSTGKVAIGTSSPSWGTFDVYGHLTVSGDGYGKGLHITSSNTGGSPSFISRDAGAIQIGMDSAGSGGLYVRMYSGGYGDRLHISNGGTFTGSGSNDISDERLKENIATIPDALTKINQLKGRNFTWKTEANLPEQTGTQYGFIAQEVESIIPEAVWGGSGICKFKKGTSEVIDDGESESGSKFDPETEEWAKSVAHSKLIPVLVEAVKELSAKVKALEDA